MLRADPDGDGDMAGGVPPMFGMVGVTGAGC